MKAQKIYESELDWVGYVLMVIFTFGMVWFWRVLITHAIVKSMEYKERGKQ